MTSEELGLILQLKESYIRNHWTRIVDSFGKKGIQLYKVGRGEDAIYGFETPWTGGVIWDSDEMEMFG